MKFRYLVAWITGLLLAGFVLEGILRDSPAGDEVERQQVSAEEMGEGRLPELLERLGALEPVAGTGARSAAGEDARPAWRTPPAAAEPGRSAAGRSPDSTALRELVPFHFRRKGLRTVSIHTDPQGLEWIRQQPMEQREVPAAVAVLEGQRVLFTAYAGLRLHGGTTRTFGPSRSWRLMFRAGDGFAPSLLGWAAGPALESLIIRNSLRVDRGDRQWRYTNAMAFDVVRRMGGEVPHTAPALLFINGENRGFFFLTERIDRGFLRRRYGHDRFVFVWTKDADYRSIVRWGNPLLYERLMDLFPTRTKAGPRRVARWVDLDNLDRWFLSVLFCATTDAYQGALLRDEGDPAGRWFWLHWDMDQSFMAALADRLDPWNSDIWSTVTEGSRHDLRARLLRSLTVRSEEYRRRLAGRAALMLDRQLTPPFLAELLGRYREIERRYEVDDTESLELIGRFFEERPRVLRQRLAERLGPLPAPHDDPLAANAADPR
ncbi:MAG: CotH kinase family protein [Acidobacteriota bacterium]